MVLRLVLARLPHHCSLSMPSQNLYTGANSRGEILLRTIMNFSSSHLCCLWCVLYTLTESVVNHCSMAVQRTLLQGTSELDQSAWLCQPRKALHRHHYICVPPCTVLLLGVTSFWQPFCFKSKHWDSSSNTSFMSPTNHIYIKPVFDPVSNVLVLVVKTHRCKWENKCEYLRYWRCKINS